MQVFFQSIVLGSVYSILGLSFALIYRSMKIFPLALGAIFSIAPYLLMTLLDLGLPLALGFLLVGLLGGIINWLCELWVHWPLERKKASLEIQMIASLGTYIVLVQVLLLCFGSDSHILPVAENRVFSALGARITSGQLVQLALGLIIWLSFWSWLRRSRKGLELRAMSENPILLSLLGINIRALRSTAFILSGALVSLVAMGRALDLGFTHHEGLANILIGMVVVVMAGPGNFRGILVSGFILGAVNSISTYRFSLVWTESITFLVLVGFLFFKPRGLFGSRLRVEGAK